MAAFSSRRVRFLHTVALTEFAVYALFCWLMAARDGLTFPTRSPDPRTYPDGLPGYPPGLLFHLPPQLMHIIEHLGLDALCSAIVLANGMPVRTICPSVRWTRYAYSVNRSDTVDGDRKQIVIPDAVQAAPKGNRYRMVPTEGQKRHVVRTAPSGTSVTPASSAIIPDTVMPPVSNAVPPTAMQLSSVPAVVSVSSPASVPVPLPASSATTAIAVPAQPSVVTTGGTASGSESVRAPRRSVFQPVGPRVRDDLPRITAIPPPVAMAHLAPLPMTESPTVEETQLTLAVSDTVPLPSVTSAEAVMAPVAEVNTVVPMGIDEIVPASATVDEVVPQSMVNDAPVLPEVTTGSDENQALVSSVRGSPSPYADPYGTRLRRPATGQRVYQDPYDDPIMPGFESARASYYGTRQVRLARDAEDRRRDPIRYQAMVDAAFVQVVEECENMACAPPSGVAEALTFATRALRAMGRITDAADSISREVSGMCRIFGETYGDSDTMLNPRKRQRRS